MMGFMVLLQYPSQVSTSKKPAGTQPQTAWSGDTATIGHISHLGPDPERFPTQPSTSLSKEPSHTLWKVSSLAVAPRGNRIFAPGGFPKTCRCLRLSPGRLKAKSF